MKYCPRTNPSTSNHQQHTNFVQGTQCYSLSLKCAYTSSDSWIQHCMVQVMIQNLFFFRGVGSLSQPRINIFTVGNMRVMICLGQGGRRSLSASSISHVIVRDFFQNKDAGDLTERKKLRERLQCKSLQWFLDNIYPDKYIPTKNTYGYGKVSVIIATQRNIFYKEYIWLW